MHRRWTFVMGCWAFVALGAGCLEPQSGVPAGATSLTASVDGDVAHLTWIDNSDDETGFAIMRKTGELGMMESIDTATKDATSYDDTPLDVGATYIYVVRAVNGPLKGDNSNEASITVPALSPSDDGATR